MGHRLERIICGILAASAALSGTGLAAEEGPADLNCRFETGHTWTYEAGQFKSASPSPLAFSIQTIDLEKQTATMAIDGKRAGTLRVVRALNANSFLEVAQEGFLNLTTVYDKDAQTGVYPAVHSRHVGLLGQPMFSQYTGTCTATPGGK